MAKNQLSSMRAASKMSGAEAGKSSKALAIGCKLLEVGLAFCNVKEDLRNSKELAELDDEILKRFKKAHPHMARIKGSNDIRNAELGRRPDQHYFVSIPYEKLAQRWMREERYAAGLYALLGIVDDGVRLLYTAQRSLKVGESIQGVRNHLEQLFVIIGRSTIEILVSAGHLGAALKLMRHTPELGAHSTTVATLLRGAITARRIGDIEFLRARLAETEPGHSLLNDADDTLKRLSAYEAMRASQGVDIGDLNNLSGVAFEELLAGQFHALGYKTELLGRSGDYGADLRVTTENGSTLLVQCKRHNRKVNLKAVQEVVGALGHYGGDFGVVITNNSFLKSAVQLAEAHDVELWGSEHLARFLSEDLSFSEIRDL